MKNGSARFDFFLTQLQTLLQNAALQKNPALWLYQNNVRTPLFMLEGLAKVYSNLHNKKMFTKLKEHFKILEDTLGAVDYYDSFAKEFAANEAVPEKVKEYLQAQSREKIQSLNEILTENKWLGENAGRIKKIQKKLADADWLKEKKEVNALNEFYGKAIYEIVEFTHKTKFHFDNVEADVHELRRKLRWLSIYPQALRGSVQLSKMPQTPGHLIKYLVPEILNSPYNKMPDAGPCNYFLLLNENYFYALSWLIAELGKLKDTGLKIIAIKEALQQTTGVLPEEALNQTAQIIGAAHPTLQQLLDDAERVCKTFFDEHNLEHLVVGVAAAK